MLRTRVISCEVPGTALEYYAGIRSGDLDVGSVLFLIGCPKRPPLASRVSDLRYRSHNKSTRTQEHENKNTRTQKHNNTRTRTQEHRNTNISALLQYTLLGMVCSCLGGVGFRNMLRGMFIPGMLHLCPLRFPKFGRNYFLHVMWLSIFAGASESTDRRPALIVFVSIGGVLPVSHTRDISIHREHIFRR